MKQMKLTRGKDAQYMRAWLSELSPEETFTAREVGDAMAEAFPNVSFGTLKNRWQTLKHRGMVDSVQADGRHWEYWLTPDGIEFWEWMMNTDEGRAWGQSKTVKKKRSESAPPTPVIEDEVTFPLVFDREEPDEFGLLWAKVPVGADVVWVGVDEETGKKKPHKIARESDQEQMSEVDKLKAKLRALGEDI